MRKQGSVRYVPTCALYVNDKAQPCEVCMYVIVWLCACVRGTGAHPPLPPPPASTHQTGLHPGVMELGSSAPLGTGELSDVSSSTPASRHEYLWGYISKPKDTNYSIAPTQQARFLHSHLPSSTWKSFFASPAWKQEASSSCLPSIFMNQSTDQGNYLL